MLRITVQQDLDSTALLLEGKLAGEWVDELRGVWASARAALSRGNVVVSLTDVSFVNSAGRRLLSEIHTAGGVLIGSGLLARTLIEEITGKSL
jgi:hypothetical protein